MKKIKMILLILILTVTIINLVTGNSMAGDKTHGEINTTVYKTTVDSTDAGKLTDMTSDILATIRSIGIISAVVVLSVIGIKYMLGSLDEKANYKENMVIYIIGCFLLMAATTIPSIVYDIMK